MTERKPFGMSWEAWTELQIRQGAERGELEVSADWKGKPIPGRGQQDDELWWVRRKLRDEDVQYLPPQLAVRQEVDEARAKIAAARSEAEVRRLVGAVNERIRHVNRTTVTGPPTTVMVLDVDEVLERWRSSRAES